MANKVTKKSERSKKTASKAKRPVSPAQSDSRTAASKTAPRLDDVRARAFEIYASGRNQGDPVADWFQAEQELQDTSA